MRYCPMICGPHLKPCVFTYPHDGDCECLDKSCREIAELKRNYYSVNPKDGELCKIDNWYESASIAKRILIEGVSF